MIPIPPQPCLPNELVASPVFLLGRLGFELKRRAADELEDAGFSVYDFSVLTFLAQGACDGQMAIADVLRLDRSQLVGLLDGLEERGLIERRRDPSDRRRHTVSLTSDGRRQLTRLRAVVKRIEDEFLAPLEPAEREQLHGLLVTLARHHDARFAQPVAAAAS